MLITRKFVKEVSTRANLPEESVRAVLDAVKGVTTDVLRLTGEVRVPGLVNMKVIPRQERMARNPRTGESHKVNSGHTLKCRAVSSLVRDTTTNRPA